VTLHEHLLELRDRRLRRDARHVRPHHARDRPLGEPVRERAVEVLPGDDADQLAVVLHRHRVDAQPHQPLLGGGDGGARRARVQVRRRQRRRRPAGAERLADRLEQLLGELHRAAAPHARRRRGRVAAAAKRRQQPAGVEALVRGARDHHELWRRLEQRQHTGRSKISA